MAKVFDFLVAQSSCSSLPLELFVVWEQIQPLDIRCGAKTCTHMRNVANTESVLVSTSNDGLINKVAFSRDIAVIVER